MRVLLLTTHLNVGGISVYTVGLAKQLKKTGISVAVASSGGELEEGLRSDGIECIRLDIKTKAEFGLKVWKSLPRLVKIIREGAFELIHAQTRVSQVLASMAGAMAGVPYVTTCHGFFEHGRLARRLVPCWGSRTIAISDSVKDHLIDDFKLPPKNVTRIYNGINLGAYASGGAQKDRSLAQRLGLPDGCFVVGTVGRLSSVKGYCYLVSAFKDVLEKHPEVRLLIVGEGPEADRLRRQASELGIMDKICMDKGGVPLSKYLYLMDIFCLTSLQEGLGLALMEAMAAGRPSVASNVGGLAELITHEKDGILVPPSDVKALSGAISRLVEDSGLRETFAKEAREKAMKNFSLEDSVMKTAQVYRDILREKSAGGK